jgi:hypothetical protein
MRKRAVWISVMPRAPAATRTEMTPPRQLQLGHRTPQLTCAALIKFPWVWPPGAFAVGAPSETEVGGATDALPDRAANPNPQTKGGRLSGTEIGGATLSLR